MLVTLIINSILIAGMLIFLFIFVREARAANKANNEAHKILAKNDKKLDKNISVIYTKQMKISENITTLFAIAKSIMNSTIENNSNDTAIKINQLTNELSNLKKINSSLLGEIAKLQKEIKEETENEEKQEREE